jgi:hypothetical protein
VVKYPPTIILPSLCTAIVAGAASKEDQIMKPVSLLPSVFNLVIYLLAAQLYVVNDPQAIIFPSLCIAKVLTYKLNPPPIINHVSLVQSVFKRNI